MFGVVGVFYVSKRLYGRLCAVVITSVILLGYVVEAFGKKLQERHVKILIFTIFSFFRRYGSIASVPMIGLLIFLAFLMVHQDFIRSFGYVV